MTRQNMHEIDGSLQDYMQSVRANFAKQFPPTKNAAGFEVSPYWLRDIYEDSVIAEDEKTRQLYRVGFMKTADGIEFAPRPKWEKVKLSYAKETVTDSIVTEFKGAPPEIPVREGVDLEALTDGDEKPFFLALEISTVGRVSKNGLLHDEELAATLLNQINGRASEGIMGHIKETERGTAFPVSDIHWLGAARHDKSVWAKGYIPRTATAQREHFRILKATNGRAATSIAGPAVREFVDKGKGVWRAKDFQLEQLDLAPFTRAALPPQSDFVITQETVSEEVEDMGRIEELEQEAATRETRIAELQTQVSELQASVAASKAKEFDAALDAKVAELVNWQVKDDGAKAKVESFRKTLRSRILAELGEERTVERLAETATAVWAELQPLAETVRDALAGPPAVVPGKSRGDHKLVDTPETRAAAVRAFNF